VTADEDVVDIALKVGRALEQTGAAYFLGGSLASSVQGEPRATNDIDFVIDLPEQSVEAFAAMLGDDFDVDVESLRKAIRRRGSWNIFYLPYATKVDLFILRRGAYDEVEFTRRRRIELRPGQSLFIKSPEDSILRKLLWFRQGGESSSTQWRDVVQILRVARSDIEGDYLDQWAAKLGTADLLTQARAEAVSP
jgi:hypothetical protein